MERRHYLFAGTSVWLVGRETSLLTIREVVVFLSSSSPKHVFIDLPNLIDLYNGIGIALELPPHGVTQRWAQGQRDMYLRLFGEEINGAFFVFIM